MEALVCLLLSIIMQGMRVFVFYFSQMRADDEKKYILGLLSKELFFVVEEVP